MNVTLLTLPACPNAALAEERLAAAMAGLPGFVVTRSVVADERTAAAAGMHGSPTFLINGADPFAYPGAPTSPSCRLYRQPDGSLAGAPPADALRRAVTGT